MKNNFIYLAILAAGFASCEPEFENEVDANYTAGDADFTTYVAIGNSLTAGYMDGTVSRVGQTYSFPNLLAQKFALVGGGEFTQPSYADDVNNLGGLMLGGVPILDGSGKNMYSTRLVIDASQSRPENITGVSTIQVSELQATAYNNMGVPGAKSFHLLSNTYGDVAGVVPGTANPYFVRHATSASATVLGDAMSKNPTFFTNWIGGNDVLAYATGGGTIADDMTTPNIDESLSNTAASDNFGTSNDNFAGYNKNDITSINVFNSAYNTIINTLTSNGAKGVVATIPSVTSIPYFTTVPYAPLTAQSMGKALAPEGSDVATQIAYGTAAMNQANTALYNNLDAIFTAYGEPNRVNALNPNTANPILIYDVDAADRSAQITAVLTPTLGAATATAFGQVFGKARQTTANDLIVLPASSVIGSTNTSSPSPLININGVTFPMVNKWVLTANEKLKVANATAAYNASIVSIAASKNLAVADMNAILGQLVSGLRIETGQVYTANYFSGSATEGTVLFSLDGVHPNARGYAVIANEIIKVINRHYNANIPLHHPSYFPGINIVPSN